MSNQEFLPKPADAEQPSGKGVDETACSRLLPPPMNTAMVFAARYTHHRNTGGTLAVCRALAWCWDQLDERTQKQILDESHEATSNLDDWAQFRGDDSPANPPDHSPQQRSCD
jgi:hypothetical protein